MLRSHFQTSVAALLVALPMLGTGCASSPRATSGNIPAVVPGREAVEGWTEELRPGPGFRIILRNNSPAAVRITSVQLYDCENVDHACGPYDPHLVLRAGQSIEVLRVGPSMRDYAFNFRYRFSWGSAGGTP